MLADPDEEYVRDQSNWFSLYFVIIGIVIAVATFMQVRANFIIESKSKMRIGYR